MRTSEAEKGNNNNNYFCNFLVIFKVYFFQRLVYPSFSEKQREARKAAAPGFLRFLSSDGFRSLFEKTTKNSK